VDARFLTSPAARPVLACGRQSLEIFCLSILLSALGHFVLSEYNSGLSMQLAVNLVGIATMCLTARLIDWYKTMDRIPMLQPALAGRRRDDNAAE
jgi:inner membrane protein involved in colicin E2 resistance